MTDLFDHAQQERLHTDAPLAERMRPTTLEELVGQEAIIGQDKILRQAIKRDELFSMILWGPPGSGKTTIARLIAATTKSAFVQMSAVSSGVKDLKKIIDEARERGKFRHQRTILFLDEIHRWNKAQQDALLPHVESGEIILIGATTENPSFQVISPLLSRARVYVLERLSEENLRSIVERALKDKVRGLGSSRTTLDDDALALLLQTANGDARLALNGLEVAAKLSRGSTITKVDVEQALQKPALLYDRQGDEHYAVISAFIKSIRGSDPDAGLYWLARMLEAGEDARFIARRLVILASEDIGNADPQALLIATAAAHGVEYIGLPEAQLNLAQAVTYLAEAPKSNASYMGLLAAKEDVRATLNLPVPLHLRNAVTDLDTSRGVGKDYKYSHDYAPDSQEGNQAYRPQELEGHVYYAPGSEREEKKRTKGSAT